MQDPQQTVVVTGAASGMGLSTVQTFLRSGWKVVGLPRERGRS